MGKKSLRAVTPVTKSKDLKDPGKVAKGSLRMLETAVTDPLEQTEARLKTGKSLAARTQARQQELISEQQSKESLRRAEATSEIARRRARGRAGAGRRSLIATGLSSGRSATLGGVGAAS